MGSLYSVSKEKVSVKSAVISDSVGQENLDFEKASPNSNIGITDLPSLHFDGPEVPDLAESPPLGDFPSNYDGQMLPLQPPVLFDIDSSSSSSDDENNSEDQSPEQLQIHLESLKSKLRRHQLKIERKKLLLKDLKKVKKNKMEDRRKVKEKLSELIDRQANLEHWLKEVFLFVSDIKERQNDTKITIYQTDKEMVDIKLKMNEIMRKLGLDGVDIDEKKMVELERLNKKRKERNKRKVTKAFNFAFPLSLSFSLEPFLLPLLSL